MLDIKNQIQKCKLDTESREIGNLTQKQLHLFKSSNRFCMTKKIHSWWRVNETARIKTAQSKYYKAAANPDNNSISKTSTFVCLQFVLFAIIDYSQQPEEVQNNPSSTPETNFILEKCQSFFVYLFNCQILLLVCNFVAKNGQCLE